jgi:hypothetical protein
VVPTMEYANGSTNGSQMELPCCPRNDSVASVLISGRRRNREPVVAAKEYHRSFEGAGQV